jgi:hypothetical protein
MAAVRGLAQQNPGSMEAGLAQSLNEPEQMCRIIAELKRGCRAQYR